MLLFVRRCSWIGNGKLKENYINGSDIWRKLSFFIYLWSRLIPELSVKASRHTIYFQMKLFQSQLQIVVMANSSNTVHSCGFHIPALGHAEHVGGDCGLRRVESRPFFCTSQSGVMTDLKRLKFLSFQLSSPCISANDAWIKGTGLF